MSEWKWKTIEDLGDITTGKTPSTKVPEFWDGTVPFITPKDIQGTKHCYQTERCVTQIGSKSAGKVQLDKGAICVSCIGNIGYVAMTTEDSISNQQINSISVNSEHSEDFVYYLMKNLWPYFKKCESQGTSVPILSKSLFSKIPVYVPGLTTQEKISTVLSALDDKIELNHRLNDNLEAMAQALYDYWFVQFDFPDENGKPYKSSGGKMVWNSQLKQEIPDGWDVTRISDVCDINSQAYQTKDAWSHVEYLDTSNLTENVISEITHINLETESLPSRAKRKVQHLDVLFSSVRPNQRHLGIILNPPSNLLVSTGFVVLSAQKEKTSPYMIYCIVKSEEVVQAMQKIGELATSSYPSIRPEDLASVQFATPKSGSNLFASYNRVVAPLYQRIDNIKQEIKKLTKQRDFLLPLLMNGQVQVKPLNYRLSDD